MSNISVCPNQNVFPKRTTSRIHFVLSNLYVPALPFVSVLLSLSSPFRRKDSIGLNNTDRR